MVKAYTRINHHQMPFDTRWRNLRWTLGQHGALANLWNRYQWYTYPKSRRVAAFPLHVDIESTADCNMNCPMCYRSQLPEGSIAYIDFEVYKRLVDECAAKRLYSIRLSWRGEPLLHPDIVGMVRYAKEQGIRNVSFLTNGLLLKGELAEQLIDAGLSYLSVSFDGVKDVYNRIRKPSRFEEAYNRLREFKELKRRKNSLTPLVRVCTVWPAVAHDPQEYREIMSKVTDKIVYNPFIDFNDPNPTPIENFVCQYPWQRISITSAGKIMPCTGVSVNEGYPLGTVADTTISEAWHSEKLQQLRDKHSSLRRMDVPVCAACRHGMVKDPFNTEGFDLDGKTIWIE